MKSTKTVGLETGARLMQDLSPLSPLSQFDTHLVGFHPMKQDPHMQMAAHHYCRQVNQDFMQCVIFDGPGRDGRLTGVEYIITAELYERLPEEERRYWHPHNYEILSGTLVAPWG